MNVFEQHPKAAYLLGLSRLLERGGYYGTRALLVLFMMEEYNMDIKAAMGIYGLFSTGVYLAKAAGGFLGDLLIGNNKAIIGGVLLQVVGILLLSTQVKDLLEVALVIFAIGSGLYGPNMIGEYGKLYLKKRRIIDAGFVLFYLMVNVGAFCGILFIGKFIGDFKMGFYVAAAVMALSVVPYLLSNPQSEQDDLPPTKFNFSSNVTIISIIVMCMVIFWGMYELSGGQQTVYLSEIRSLFGGKYPWWLEIGAINSYSIFLFGILAFFIWSRSYISQMNKMIIGFLLASLSYLIFLMIPEAVDIRMTLFYVGAGIILSLAELLIVTGSLSIYVLLSKPNRIASTYGVTALVLALGNRYVFQDLWKLEFLDSASGTFITCTVICSFVGSAIYLFKKFYKAKLSPEYAAYKEKPSEAEDGFTDESDELDQLK